MMRTMLTRRTRSLLTALVLALGASTVSATEIVIANPSVTASELDENTLKDLFLGKTSQLAGTGIMPVTLTEGPVHDSFLRTYLGKSSKQFESHWRSLMFSGKAAHPPIFSDEKDVVDFITHTPGAIGYISDATPHDGVKVLAVN